MNQKWLRFVRLRDMTPSGMDGNMYRLDYEVGELFGGQFRASGPPRSIVVSTSGTLQAVWRKSDDEMAALASAKAVSMLQEGYRQYGLEGLPERLQLNTFTVPHVPPEVKSVASGAVIALDDATLTTPERPALSFLSDDISAVRDQINALAKVIWKERLLFLSQERPLFDMYKSARSAEEFSARIQSLTNIAKDLNRELLLRLVQPNPKGLRGEFVLLEAALGKIAAPAEIKAICQPLKELNNLRQGYPTHSDTAERLLSAHSYFNIHYPVDDFSGAWEAILAAYFASMRSLRDVLSSEWKRSSKPGAAAPA